MNMARYRHIFQIYDDPEDNNTTQRVRNKKRLRQGPEPPTPPPDEQDDPDTLIEIIQWSVDNYYGLLPENDEQMLDRYSPASVNDTRCFADDDDRKNETACPVRIDITYLDSVEQGDLPLTVTMKKDDYWIFTNETIPEVKKFMQKVVSFTITYFVKVDYPDTDTLSTSCFDWTIVQKYDYTNRGIIRLTLHLE